MQTYNEKQVKQLTRLIEVTRTNLSKADRQKVCGCGVPQKRGAGGWLLLPNWVALAGAGMHITPEPD